MRHQFVQPEWLDALESHLANFALVTILVQVNSFDVDFQVAVLFELLGTDLAFKPSVLMDDPLMSQDVLPGLEHGITEITSVRCL